MQEQVNQAVESAKEAAASVTERVSDFFQGNPFATPVGHKIEMATDPSILTTENWGLNMEICDFINNTPEGGRDAVRAIRKRLHSQVSKNNAAVMYTLTVLETCVKNCNIEFHELVCQKDFLNELVKLLDPKFDAPQIIQEHILGLIQSWNGAFQDEPRLQGVCQVYNELKSKGVQFPVIDPDSMAPILTPKRTVFPVGKTLATMGTEDGVAELGMSNPGSHDSVDLAQLLRPTPEQEKKLRKELDVINENLKVMREMLSEMVSGKKTPDDLQLLDELHAVVKPMHVKIQDLIRCIHSDEVMHELLVVNDECNNLFEKYDHCMVSLAYDAKKSEVPESSLIEFDDEALDRQFSALKTSDASDFMGENASGLRQHTGTTPWTVETNKNPPVDDKEAAEIAEWLDAQEGKKGASVISPITPPSGSSSKNKPFLHDEAKEDEEK